MFRDHFQGYSTLTRRILSHSHSDAPFPIEIWPIQNFGQCLNCRTPVSGKSISLDQNRFTSKVETFSSDLKDAVRRAFRENDCCKTPLE
jgi:hypothetical protein